MSRPPLEVADLVRAAGDTFIERSRKWITWKHVKVPLAIARCRTATRIWIGNFLLDGISRGDTEHSSYASETWCCDLRSQSGSCGAGMTCFWSSYDSFVFYNSAFDPSGI